MGHTGSSACPLKETGGYRLLLHAGCYHLGAATGGRCCVPWGQRASHNTHVWIERAGAQGHPIVRVARATDRSGSDTDLATRDLSRHEPRRAPKPYPGCRPSTAAAAAPPVASTPLPPFYHV